MKYGGHSNGCRAALDSLSSWGSAGKTNLGKTIYNGSEVNIDMSSNPVDSFVGVGCPGNFSELSYFAKQVDESGEIAIQRLREDGNLHPTFGQVAHELESASGEVAGLARFFKNPRLSLNLFEQYYNWISSNTDSQPGKDMSFEYFTIIKGRFISENDLIVPIKDEEAIFDNIQSTNKNNITVNIEHVGMAENNEVKNYVKVSLNKN